jgi:tetratricopeptide (TPR) repeat protein
MTLDDELDRIFQFRDRSDMQPTIAALLPLLAEHPHQARVLYEVGGAYDTAGEERLACSFYERALAAGLSGDLLRRCYLQYGSTLRNLGQHDRALEVLGRARRAFPDSPSLAVFEALSLHAAGLPDRAFAALLDAFADAVHAPDIDRYKAALRANADYLRSTDRA